MLSVASLVQIAHQNQDKIERYLHGKSKESFDDPNKPKLSDDYKKLLGMAIGVFITILVIAIIFWVVALVLLVKYWDQLTDGAKIIGVFGVLPILPIGPLFTILAVMIGRK
jgi:hypothetical protein